MNLPHQKPVLFAKKIISIDKKSAQVECEFPFTPTLPMLLEAAAQASSAFSEQKEGFLAGASDIKLYKKVINRKVLICVNEEISMGSMKIFSFQIKDICEGKFTIHVK